jgi:hypothetical protein
VLFCLSRTSHETQLRILIEKILDMTGFASITTIDLELTDQQSVGKRSRHLMDTVNAKKRWTTVYWRVNF